MSITIHAFAVKSSISKKTGNPYFYQQIEIQQHPYAPNALGMIFHKSEADALSPGLYTCDVVFQAKDGRLSPQFQNFQAQ